jgi:hypothetical protein
MRSRGEKNFDRCQVRTVETINWAFALPTALKTTNGLIVPAGGAGTVPKVDSRDAAGPYAGSSATLTCPITEDRGIELNSDGANHNGAIRAFKNLREKAGLLACANCQFANMSPVEVAVERATLAHAEAERVEALRLRAEAVAELTALDPSFRDAF